MNQRTRVSTIDRGKHFATRLKVGFTLVELLVVVGVICVLLALFAPTARYSAGSARRIDCANRLRQIGIAIHNFADAHQQLPNAFGPQVAYGITLSSSPEIERLNGLVTLLPYIEEFETYDGVFPTEKGNVRSFPHTLYGSSTAVWRETPSAFKCATLDDSEGPFGKISYGFCGGDVVNGFSDPNNVRSPFGKGLNRSFDDFVDGTSCTIALGEIGGPATTLGSNVALVSREEMNVLADHELLSDKNLRRNFKTGLEFSMPGRGGHWGDGSPGSGIFNTVLAPGSASFEYRDEDYGVYSAALNHPAGCNVVFVDASTHLIPTRIDTGDLGSEPPNPTSSPASPFGPWGAMGTINSNDEVDPLSF